MTKNIEKPIILKVRDLETEIVNLINLSGVPAFILKPSIEKIYKQLELLEIQEYSKAEEEYKSNTDKK